MNNGNTRRGCTQTVQVGRNRFFTSPLEGEDVRRTKEGAWNESGCVIPLPQGARRTNGGFTLIELLVVVLIIGILAAVAVPQYQKAVLKSRITQVLPFIHAVYEAQQVYFLANAEYASTLEALDIDYTCPKDWECVLSSSRVKAMLTDGNSLSIVLYYTSQLVGSQSLDVKDKPFCYAALSQATAAAVCRSLGPEIPYENTNAVRAFIEP